MYCKFHIDDRWREGKDIFGVSRQFKHNAKGDAEQKTTLDTDMALPVFRWDHFDKTRLAAIAGNRLDKGRKVSELVHGGTKDRDAAIVVVVIGLDVNGGMHCFGWAAEVGVGKCICNGVGCAVQVTLWVVRVRVLWWD